MKRLPWWSLPLALAAFGAASCDDRPRALITLAPVADDAKTLYVSVTYRGMPALKPAPISFDLSTRDRSRPASFGLYLPAMTDGDLSIGAGIIDSAKCLSAVGSGYTSLLSASSRLEIAMSPIPTDTFTTDERCSEPESKLLLIGAKPSMVSSKDREQVTLFGWWGVVRSQCPLVSINGVTLDGRDVSCQSVVELGAVVPTSSKLGPVPVAVRAQNGTAVAMSSSLLSYYAGSIRFESGPSYAVGAGPTALAVGLIDGDGRPDLVVANRDGGTLSVLVTGGKTELQPALTTTLPAGPRPTAVGIADLDGDHAADLVAVSATEAAVRTFVQSQPVSSPPSWKTPELTFVNLLPSALALADYSADGAIDVAVANQISSDVSLLRNDGKGHFTRSKSTDVTVEREPTAVRLADLDGDGLPELVTISATRKNLTVVPNSGGVFGLRSAIDLGDAATALLVEDLDGNGSREVIAALSAGGLVIYWNDGQGITAKSEQSRLSLPPGIVAMASGDIDLDGRPDVVVASERAQNISVLRNKLTRQKVRGLELSALSSLPASARPTALAVALFDGDNLPDIAVATQTSGQPAGAVQIFTNKSE